jgi:hypothetical protein
MTPKRHAWVRIVAAQSLDRTRVPLEAGGLGAGREVPQPDGMVIGARGDPPVVPGLAVFYRVSGFVLWHFLPLLNQGSLKHGRLPRR